jgi:hypothetical protein
MTTKTNKLTIDDFTFAIGWDVVQSVMIERFGKREGAKMFHQLNKWMRGQTCTPYGIFHSDLRSFLESYPKKAPVYD